ncbi:hypothetical protein FRC06_008570 [Ceratobasidium sp. 370]|nr:hypothetical protein FRC06_008570 [Ceratobasidium sp. 370]
MAQAAHLAHTRLRLRHENEQHGRARETSQSLTPNSVAVSARLPSPPELLEDDEEECVAAEAEALGLDPAVNSLPTFRGRSKEVLRPFTEFYFGFKKPATTPDAIAHNIALAGKLLPNSFHCHAYDPPFGHYEGEALRLAIAIVIFGNPMAVGVAFRGYFNPMPETAVAYVLANMQFTIEEWETGKFLAKDLNASDMLNKYVAHLRGLKAARRRAKHRFQRLAQEWYDFGFEYSGAMELDDPFTQSVTLEEDVRPDTPTSHVDEGHDYLPEEPEELESEPEGGRYTKHAKGKGRA